MNIIGSFSISFINKQLLKILLQHLVNVYVATVWNKFGTPASFNIWYQKYTYIDPIIHNKSEMRSSETSEKYQLGITKCYEKG